MEVKGLRFACCFCDREIAHPEEGVQVIAIWESGGEEVEQYWWGHKECFESKLNPIYREFRTEWYDDEGEEDAYM